MGLDSLLSRLKTDVTDVTDVTPSNGAGCRRNVSIFADVTDVTNRVTPCERVTSVTSCNVGGVTENPFRINGVTPVTPVTSKNIIAGECLSDSGGQDAANHPQTFRHWRARDPDGRTWEVSRCPAASAAEVSQAWLLGTVLEPVSDEASQPPGPPLSWHREGAIRAWLKHIEEHDPCITSEVLERARRDPDALRFYLLMAQAVPELGPKTCGDCGHYQRIDRPHLGHCGMGEWEPLGGLWDSQARLCGKWEVRP